MKTIMGIDYSMTSPALCVFSGNGWSHEECKFFFFGKKKSIIQHNQFFGTEYPNYTTDQQRFDNLSSWVMDIAIKANVTQVFIEAYSFSSVGSRIYQIGENCGLLKHKLWKSNIPFTTFAPTQIKKFATQKGNANKELMCNTFQVETNLDIRKLLDLGDKQWNPISDIVDSYYITKLGFQT